jgi:hypothetical protein
MRVSILPCSRKFKEKITRRQIWNWVDLDGRDLNGLSKAKSLVIRRRMNLRGKSGHGTAPWENLYNTKWYDRMRSVRQ